MNDNEHGAGSSPRIEPLLLTRDAAHVVALELLRWWSRGPASQDMAGPGEPVHPHAALAATIGSELADKAERVRDDVGEVLLEYLQRLPFRRLFELSIDYSPNPELEALADACGLPLARLPWKHRLEVEGGRVRVWRGYGRDPVTLLEPR